MDEHAVRELDAAMQRLADGDRGACSSVFSLLWPELVGFAQRTLGKGPDADDVAQQALEKIFAQAADYDPTRPALPWALAIAGWECRTLLQRRRRRREEPLELDAPSARTTADDPDPEAATLERTMMDALREAIGGLSSEDRQTLEQAF